MSVAAPAEFEFAPHGAAVSSFDLDVEAQRLRTEAAYVRTGRNAITLSATHDHHLVLVAQHSGRRVDPHRCVSRITVEVISGELRVRAGEGAERRESLVGRHGLVTIDRHVLHAIEATEDSVYLLTISGGLRSD